MIEAMPLCQVMKKQLTMLFDCSVHVCGAQALPLVRRHQVSWHEGGSTGELLMDLLLLCARM